jgi:hypothetical protein
MELLNKAKKYLFNKNDNNNSINVYKVDNDLYVFVFNDK